MISTLIMAENKILEKYTLCLGYLSQEGIASGLAKNGKEIDKENLPREGDIFLLHLE